MRKKANSQGAKAIGGKRRINLTINGQPHELEIGKEPYQVDPAHTLAHTLRETLRLTGTKVSCDHGACGWEIGPLAAVLCGQHCLSMWVLYTRYDHECKGSPQ
jgi:xanthine dehydrogenase iron-sulfur cluster and FAD-binding subunit A